MRKITALLGLGLGAWMMFIYTPTSEHAVKIGFVAGSILLLLGITNFISACIRKK